MLKAKLGKKRIPLSDDQRRRLAIKGTPIVRMRYARDQMITPIKSYSFFDPLRGDPRFHALLRKMNL